MKNLLVSTILLVNALVVSSQGATINAASVAEHDVQAAVLKAQVGDTVVVPSGSAVWSSQLAINKQITFQGGGVGKTVIAANTGRNNLIVVALAGEAPEGAAYSFRMTGFEFRSASNSTGRGSGRAFLNFNGASVASQKPLVLGCTSKFRLDHCKFDGMKGMPCQFKNIIGVVDHVEFIGNNQPCHIAHPNWTPPGKMTIADNGYGSWADDPYWGTEKFLFFEDCDFTNTGKGISYGPDAYEGARYVIRHCRLHKNVSWTGHGTEGRQARGCKQIEAYNNTIDFEVPKQLAQLRSGSELMWGNSLTNARRGVTFQIYRLFREERWGAATGTNKWDQNESSPAPIATGTHTKPPSTILTDETKTWTPNQFDGVREGVVYIVKNLTLPRWRFGTYQQTFIQNNNADSIKTHPTGKGITWNTGDTYEIWKIRTCLDQPGQGKGRLLIGGVHNGAFAIGNVCFAEGGATASWPQAGYPLEPCYSWDNWNNRDNIPGKGAKEQLGFNSTSAVVKEGRDFFNDRQKPDYTPYRYPHPLASRENANHPASSRSAEQ